MSVIVSIVRIFNQYCFSGNSF